MHWAIEISILILFFYFFLYSITSSSSQTHHMYRQVQHHDLLCPSRFLPFVECGMRAKVHVRKGESSDLC